MENGPHTASKGLFTEGVHFQCLCPKRGVGRKFSKAIYVFQLAAGGNIDEDTAHERVRGAIFVGHFSTFRPEDPIPDVVLASDLADDTPLPAHHEDSG